MNFAKNKIILDIENTHFYVTYYSVISHSDTNLNRKSNPNSNNNKGSPLLLIINDYSNIEKNIFF